MTEIRYDDDVVDFDAAFAERDAIGIRFKFGGTTYEAPPGVPAEGVILLLRATDEGEAAKAVPLDQQLAMVDEVLGKANVSAIMKSATLEQLMEMAGVLMRRKLAASARTMAADAEGEAGADVVALDTTPATDAEAG